jgi:hypothetical protein
MDGIGAADVGAAGLGKDRKSYLLLLDQITDRAGHLLNWHGRIDAVLIEQVDPSQRREPSTASRICSRQPSPVGADLLIALLPSIRNRFGKHTISLLQDIARADRVPGTRLLVRAITNHSAR